MFNRTHTPKRIVLGAIILVNGAGGLTPALAQCETPIEGGEQP